MLSRGEANSELIIGCKVGESLRGMNGNVIGIEIS